jgi:hypothetical protein
LGRGATRWKNIKAPVESTRRGRLHAVEMSDSMAFRATPRVLVDFSPDEL